MRLRKSREEIIKEEIEDCHTILETARIEREIALILGETEALQDVGEQIKAMLLRLPVLEKLLFATQNPDTLTNNEDFIGWIVITPGGTGHGEKIT